MLFKKKAASVRAVSASRAPNKKVDVTDHERLALEVFMDTSGINLEVDEWEDGNADNLYVLTAPSVRTSALINSVEDMDDINIRADDNSNCSSNVEPDPTPLATVKEQESVLKKLGGVARYTFNMECTIN